jgi:hypothetical protein
MGHVASREPVLARPVELELAPAAATEQPIAVDRCDLAVEAQLLQLIGIGGERIGEPQAVTRVAMAQQ